MKAVSSAIAAPLKLIGLVPKKPKLPAPVKPVTRDDAAAQASLADELARRRGGAADMLTGPGGAEASGGTGKTTLG